MVYRDDGSQGHESLSLYLKEIGPITPLSKEEEIALAKKGDPKSISELVCRNLKYVVSVANRYKGCGLSLADLINEGNIGLVQAANRFDYKKNVKFITYAIWWIRQSIMHALAEQSGTVRLPIKQAGILYKIGGIYRNYTQKHKREPTSREIAKELEATDEEVEAVLRVYRSYLSLDDLITDSNDTAYIDLLQSPVPHPVDEDLLKESLVDEIRTILEELTPREKDIIRMRYGFSGDPMTLKEIGERMSLSRERVRQLEKRAKEKLLQKAKKHSLEDYIE